MYTLVQTHLPPSKKPHEVLVREMLEIRLFVETRFSRSQRTGRIHQIGDLRQKSETDTEKNGM